MEKAKVYFTKEITPESLVRIYEAMGRELPGHYIRNRLKSLPIIGDKTDDREAFFFLLPYLDRSQLKLQGVGIMIPDGA